MNERYTSPPDLLERMAAASVHQTPLLMPLDQFQSPYLAHGVLLWTLGQSANHLFLSKQTADNCSEK